MSKLTRRLALVLFALSCLFGGWAFHAGVFGGSETPLADNLVAEQRPEFRLADIFGNYREMKEWDGKVVVVNFWATWCTPCLQEIPEFVRLQAEYAERGVQFVGIALDAPDTVISFAKRLDISYPVLIGTGDAIGVAQQFGNTLGVLPYTAVVNRLGKVAHLQTGLFPTAELVPILERLSGAIEPVEPLK